MTALSEYHQSFIQCLMTHGALDSDDTKKLFNKCVQSCQGAHATEVQDMDDLRNQIYIINKAISVADLTIRPAYSPWDDCTYWGICNVTADDLSKIATILPPSEIELFFKILAELRENEGVLTLPDAQNLSTKNMTVSDNARAIQRMHQLQWLRIVRKANEQTTVVIGARSLIELPTVRTWARQFSEGRHELRDSNGGSKVEVGDVEDDDDSQMEEEEEEEEEDIRPGQRRSSSRVSTEEHEEESEDSEGSEDVVRPVSRSRRARGP